MKKYVVKYKEGGKVFGEYSDRFVAADKLMAYLLGPNSYLQEGCLTPFDFVLEEVECGDVNEEITCFEAAKRYLNLKGPNKKNIEALNALDQLFTIAEAWNKADGFVPDFLDMKQKKWFPRFKYDENTGFVFAYSVCAPPGMDAYLGSRLCFKNEKRAMQFGKQFADLYNKVYLINK